MPGSATLIGKEKAEFFDKLHATLNEYKINKNPVIANCAKNLDQMYDIKKFTSTPEIRLFAVAVCNQLGIKRAQLSPTAKLPDNELEQQKIEIAKDIINSCFKQSEVSAFLA